MDIAEQVGYKDVAYFRKMFRHYYRKSPSEFRGKIDEP